MPYKVDQRICVACGSCIGNCPNRAIVRRDDRILVTSLCCDCGVCTRYCPVGALRPGEQRVELDHNKLDAALKERLSLRRQIVAMKYADQAPEGIPVEEGPHFWCALCGDIFDGSGGAVYFTAGASSCGGCANIGIGGATSTREEFEAALYGQVIGEGKLYAAKELLSQGRSLFPRYSTIAKGVIIGSLQEVAMPDVVLFPVNGQQMCVLATAYAFDTGEVITGFAGKSTCLMSVSFPRVENRPVFTPGDHGGRTFMRLQDGEFLVCFPFKLIPGVIHNMGRTVFAGRSERAQE